MFQLTGKQISDITQSSYYHLKHYHDFGGDNAEYWLNAINQVYHQATAALDSIIITQEAKERTKLAQIFQGDCDIDSLRKVGFSNASAIQFYNTFQRGKKAGTIEEQIEALNALTDISVTSENQANGNGLTRAAQIISQSFIDGASLTSQSFEDLDEYAAFIGGLYETSKAIIDYAKNQDPMIQEMLKAAARKLNAAISYYKNDYLKQTKLTEQARQKVSALFASMDQFIQVNGKKNWTRHKTDAKTFSSVQAVIQHSASGFLKQSGGKQYEKEVVKSLSNSLSNVFASTKVIVTDKGASVVGMKTDSLNKQQKADIALTFSLTSTASNLEQFNLTFSVKKKDSNSSIQIHHGGSLFAYEGRFNAIGGEYGIDFSFLNEGNFQYVYVNELREGGREGAFLDAFRRMLQGVGFLFLGEEVGNIAGADFLFTKGRIYAFSTILKKIKLQRDAFSVNITGSKRNVLSEKVKLINTTYADVKEYYSDAFIQDSIKIGKKAIYGTQFSINLKTSYLG